MIAKKIQAILLLSALSILTYSQSPLFDHQAFLPETEVKTIYSALQDSKGMMWFATSEGAYTFNGFNFRLSSISDSTGGIPVTSMFECKDKKIWFGHNNGQISFCENEKCQFLPFEGIGPQTRINAIIEDNNGVLWFSTYGEGIFYLKNNTLFQISSEDGLSENYCYDMVRDEAGDIWVGTDNGISICKLKNEDVIIKQLTVKEGLNDFIVQSLSKCDESNIWIGFEDNGINSFSCKTEKLSNPNFENNWPYGSVNDIISFDDYVWIVTQNSGIIEYDMVFEIFDELEIPEGKNIKNLKSLFRDLEGNIWLISDREIFKTSGKNLEVFHVVDEYNIQDVYAISTDNKGQTWFANEDGIFRFSDLNVKGKKLAKFSIPILSQNKQVMCIFPDEFGFIWIGTFGKGVIRLNPLTGNYKVFTENEGLINNNVLSITGNGNHLWFGTLGGASHCLLDERASITDWQPIFTNYGRIQGLGNNYIYQVFEDINGVVWFATDGNGISRFKNGEFESFTDEKGGLDSRIVYSITQDTDGTIWANTLNKGLYRFVDNRFEKFPEIQEIENEQIQGIISADTGFLFVLTNQSAGFLDYERNIFKKVIEQNSRFEFQPDLNNLTKDSNGNILIGTKSGIMKFSTDLEYISSKPQPLIKSVSVVFEPIDLNTQLVYNYTQNHFRFSYIGLWYQNPEDVTYQVKLEGQDLDWIKTNDRSIAYSNLSPGKYTFRVIAGLDNYFNESEAQSWLFEIKEPFWQTSLFYFLILIILLVVVFLFIKTREKRIKKKQELLRNKIEFQFETLKSQVNPHFLFNSFSTLIALIETNTEDAVEYVEGLSDLFRNILEQKDKQTITIKEELRVIENYYKLQKKRYGDNLHLQIQDKNQFWDFNIPPMTLQMLIENAIKHNVVSRLHPLKIRVFYNAKTEMLIVENNVLKKKNGDTSYGIGINNIVSRFKILANKDVIITENESAFRVELPVIVNPAHVRK